MFNAVNPAIIHSNMFGNIAHAAVFPDAFNAITTPLIPANMFGGLSYAIANPLQAKLFTA